jgi:hypothetical protein
MPIWNPVSEYQPRALGRYTYIWELRLKLGEIVEGRGSKKALQVK